MLFKANLHLWAMGLLALALLTQCRRPPSKFNRNYPSYTAQKNTQERLPHLNDSTLVLKRTAPRKSYGYTEKDPIMLGLTQIDSAANNRFKYLNALRGPNGEPVTYKRLKPCCPFKTPNYKDPWKPDKQFGLIERFEVRIKGQAAPVILFINFFDQGKALYVPQGFGAMR